MNDLLAKAQAAPAGNKCNYDVLVPVVLTLRGKGWTYKAIHQWLQAEGVRVTGDYISFAASMGKRLKHQHKTQ